MGSAMKRGDIVYDDLSPTVGSEINKRRPVMILSDDTNNRGLAPSTSYPRSPITRHNRLEPSPKNASPAPPLGD